MLYQFWLFVAAGLYAHERKVVTRYVPLSLALLISGMVFVYYLVLPWTLKFFMTFSIAIPLPEPTSPTTRPATTMPALIIPTIAGEPEEKLEGQLWFDQVAGRLKLFHNGKTRVIPFGPESLTAPLITLPNYIDLVFGMLLTFGLSFQMPLAVMALVAVGIVERAALKASRQYVYFAMAIVAAVITPGDVITATVALMVPLCLLFELGIWLSRDPGSTFDEGEAAD
jgi:sec-independent protein translocase protein TatC